MQTLCNACGIKYHKKRRALLGVQSGKSEKPKSVKKIKFCSSASRLDDEGQSESSVRVPLKIKMVMKKFNGGRKLGEEEQAALLLMALSCGSLSVLGS